MLSTLILASALATQANYSDGPIREWHEAVVGGKTVHLWGWKNPSGPGIEYYRHENAHVFNPPPATSKPAAVPLGAGMILEANGTINSGVNLQAANTSTGLETNDPAFGAKLGLGDRVPDVPNDQPPSEPKEELSWPTILLVGGLVIGLILALKD